jgi:hypothetical protein
MYLLGGSTSTRAIRRSQFVIFDEHRPSLFHGHARTWAEMSQQQQSALVRSGMASRRGAILRD